jgi:hypothetical protein
MEIIQKAFDPSFIYPPETRIIRTANGERIFFPLCHPERKADDEVVWQQYAETSIGPAPIGYFSGFPFGTANNGICFPKTKKKGHDINAQNAKYEFCIDTEEPIPKKVRAFSETIGAKGAKTRGPLADYADSILGEDVVCTTGVAWMVKQHYENNVMPRIGYGRTTGDNIIARRLDEAHDAYKKKYGDVQPCRPSDGMPTSRSRSSSWSRARCSASTGHRSSSRARACR